MINDVIIIDDIIPKQYQDAIDNYNKEYLNRINLGIGIIFTIGFIGYSLITKSVPKIIPTIPLQK